MATADFEILVVEDDRFWRTALVECLLEAGYRVRSCGDGMSAIEELLEQPPDLVLMDYFLPLIDGRRLGRYINSKAELASIPIVVLSGLLIGGVSRESLPDADAAVAKGPLDKCIPQLLEIMANLLANKEQDRYREGVIEPSVLKPRGLTRKLVAIKDYVDTLHSEMAELVCEVDQQRRIIGLNRRGEALVGRPEHDLLGTNVLEALGLDPTDRLALAVDAALDPELEPRPDVSRLELRERHLEATVSRAPSAPGEISAVIVARDITDRINVEKALRDTEKQLRVSQKMEAIGRLAGGVAHDFNNVLTSIAGYADLVLTDERVEGQLRSDVEQIKRAGKRAADLTRQLLAFARKQVIKPQVLDLNETVAGLEKMLRRLIGEDIELITVPSQGIGRVEADPGQIEQILMNLAVNARDAMPDGGKLVIATSNQQLDQPYARYSWYVDPGPYVTLLVGDTGTGMDDETLLHIFEPFFTTKAEGKGSGLGLSTVYGIVKQCGGDITVQSVVGEGTQFTVYLPRCDREPDAGPELTPPPQTLGGQETILVAEDDTQLLELIQRTLQARGYRVLAGTDGNDALAVAARCKDKVDLLVTDVVMPRMGGRVLAENLLELRPGLKVLYISGYVDDGVQRGTSATLPEPLLPKPFSPFELLKAVREVLDA